MKKGFTLAELLIVVTILMLLMMAALVSWKTQINRAHDALRKKHLNDIKRAFEEYYNDNNCYPSADVMDGVEDCGSANLQPYLTAVPCDPDSKLPYKYVPMDDSCQGYRAFAGLKDTKDTDIAAQGCNGVTGCGYEPQWNYGISSGGPVARPGFDPGALPTATPPPQSGSNACAPPQQGGSVGTCNHYTNPGPIERGCPISWDTDCTEVVDGVVVNQCGDSNNWCPN